MTNQPVQKEASEMNIPLWKANMWMVVIWAMMILDIADRSAIAAVLPMIKKSFTLTDAQAGLVGGVVGLSVALFALPVAALVDRWSRRKMISIMVFLWSLLTFATGKATGFTSLIAARLGVGTGESGYNSAAYALMGAWYPKRIRGTVVGVFQTATPLGSALGVMAAGAIAYRFGWRACFGILAVPGIFLAILAWFIPDYETTKADVGEKKANTPSIMTTLKYILTSRSLIFVYLACASIMLVSQSFATWGPTFFMRVFAVASHLK